MQQPQVLLPAFGIKPFRLPLFSHKVAAGLQPKETLQATLFDDPVEQARSDGMMRVMDAINRKMGQGSVTVAASGIRQRWAMRRERKSPSYTTEWSELPVAW